MGKIKDLTGQRFGKLVAIKPLDEKQNNKLVWLCKCDCGNETNVIGTKLTSGNTKSCGCLKKKHGMFGTRLYNVWHSMKERCYVESATSYKNYGERGIKVCDEWQEFIPFMKWAYANGYDENAPRGQCTLDRIDYNGDYCPENCRWADWGTQTSNKSSNRYITYNGKTQTIHQWSIDIGLNEQTLTNRINRGWSIERALTTKPNIGNNQYTSKK